MLKQSSAKYDAYFNHKKKEQNSYVRVGIFVSMPKVYRKKTTKLSETFKHG